MNTQFYVHSQSTIQLLDRGEPPRPLLMEKPINESWVKYIEPEIIDKELYTIGYTIIHDNPISLDFKSVLRTLETVKSVLIRRSYSKYESVLSGGITLQNGTILDTMLEDRAIVIATKTKFDIDTSLVKINFKTANGWVDITRETANYLVGAIKQHEEMCSSKLSSLLTGINSALTSQEALIFYNENINEGW